MEPRSFVVLDDRVCEHREEVSHDETLKSSNYTQNLYSTNMQSPYE
jgi:hypothetical protein